MTVDRTRTGVLIASAVVLVPSAVLWSPMEAGWQGGFGRWVTMVVSLIAACAVAAVLTAIRPDTRNLSLGLAAGAIVIAPLLIFLSFVFWFVFVFHPA